MNCFKRLISKNVFSSFLALIFLLFLLGSLQIVTSQSNDGLSEDYVRRALFDIQIIDFESPLKLGEFFEFTYLLRGISEINDDVKIKFGIEKDGEVISSGSDIIYIGTFDEKIETTKLFLPSSVESGVYDFYIELVYGDYNPRSHRTIEIDVKGGIAILNSSQRGGSNLRVYIIAFLIASAFFILFFILYFERKKIKAGIIQETKWIRKHKTSSLVLLLFVVLGLLTYYLNLIEFLANVLSSINLLYVLVPVILFFILIVFLMRGKKIMREFHSWNKGRKKIRISLPKYKSYVGKAKKELPIHVKEKKLVLLPKILKWLNKISKILSHLFKRFYFYFVKYVKKISSSLSNFFKTLNKKLRERYRVRSLGLPKRRFSFKGPLKNVSREIINLKNNLIRVFSKKRKREPSVQGKNLDDVLNKYLEKEPKSIFTNFSRNINSIFESMENYFYKRNKEDQDKINSEVKTFESRIDSFLVSLLRGYRRLGSFANRELRNITRGMNNYIRSIKFKPKKPTKKDYESLTPEFKDAGKKFKSISNNLFNFIKRSDKIFWKNIRKFFSGSGKAIPTKPDQRSLIKNTNFEKTKRSFSNLYKKFTKNIGNSVRRFFKSEKEKKHLIKIDKKQIIREGKQKIKNQVKGIEDIYHDVFKLLENIFGKKTRSELVHDFEKKLVHTNKFTHKHLRSLNSIKSIRMEIKEYGRNIYHKTEDVKENSEHLIRDLTKYLRKSDLKIKSETELIIKSYFGGVRRTEYWLGNIYGNIGRGVRKSKRKAVSLLDNLGKLFKKKEIKKTKKDKKKFLTIGEMIEKAKAINLRKNSSKSKVHLKKIKRFMTVEELIEAARKKVK